MRLYTTASVHKKTLRHIWAEQLRPHICPFDEKSGKAVVGRAVTLTSIAVVIHHLTLAITVLRCIS